MFSPFSLLPSLLRSHLRLLCGQFKFPDDVASLRAQNYHIPDVRLFSHYYPRKREHNKSRMISAHCIRWFFFYKNTSRSPGLFRLHLISFSHYPSCVIGFSRYVNSFSLISFLPSRRQSEFSRSLRLPNVDILTVFLCDLLIFAPAL